MFRAVICVHVLPSRRRRLRRLPRTGMRREPTERILPSRRLLMMMMLMLLRLTTTRGRILTIAITTAAKRPRRVRTVRPRTSLFPFSQVQPARRRPTASRRSLMLLLILLLMILVTTVMMMPRIIISATPRRSRRRRRRGYGNVFSSSRFRWAVFLLHLLLLPRSS